LDNDENPMEMMIVDILLIENSDNESKQEVNLFFSSYN
jgi:hypothetical protein